MRTPRDASADALDRPIRDTRLFWMPQMRVRPPVRYGTMGVMDASQVTALRELLSTTGWPERTQDFAHALRTSARVPGSLLRFGPPDDEPWHLAAHLDDESRLNALP